MEVEGGGPQEGPPYTYSVQVNMPFAGIKITRHDCPQAAKEEGWEGSEDEIAPAWFLNAEGQESSDGLAFVGSDKEDFGGAYREQSWTLHGTPP
jgi:hypothetical protein